MNIIEFDAHTATIFGKDCLSCKKAGKDILISFQSEKGKSVIDVTLTEKRAEAIAIKILEMLMLKRRGVLQ